MCNADNQKQRMKIMMVVLNASYGGAEKHVVDIVAHIDQRQFETYVVVPEKSKLADLLEKYLPDEQILLVNRKISGMKDMKKNIQNIQPEIIHLHSPRATFLGLIASKLAKFSGRIFVTAHGWIPDRLKFKALYEWLYVKTIKQADQIIAVSHQVKETLLLFQIAETKVDVIHNAIQLPTNVKINFSNSSTIKFVFLGRFIEEKGLSVLMDAIKLLQRSDLPPFEVHLYGEGPLLPAIKQEVEENKWDYVSIHGFIPPDKVIETLNKHDVFLISSLQEGFPYTLLEAFAAGLMVISTDVGGIKEALINRKNGLLIEKENPSQLAQAIQEAINMKPNELKTYRQNAKETSLKFNLNDMVRRLESRYVLKGGENN